MFPHARKIANSISKRVKNNYLNVTITASQSTRPQPILEPEVSNTGVSKTIIYSLEYDSWY